MYLFISPTLSILAQHSTEMNPGCGWELTLFEKGCHCDNLKCEIEDIRLRSALYLHFLFRSMVDGQRGSRGKRG